jgi:hypothetical protein
MWVILTVHLVHTSTQAPNAQLFIPTPILGSVTMAFPVLQMGTKHPLGAEAWGSFGGQGVCRAQCQIQNVLLETEGADCSVSVLGVQSWLHRWLDLMLVA